MVQSRFLAAAFIFFLGSLLAAGLYLYSVKDPDPQRYAHQIAQFAEMDRLQPVQPDSILFLGSSSIRGWNLVERFPDLPVLNRGFGGSEISDINYYFDKIVGKYSASIIVLYAGENDIVGRKSAYQVLEDFRHFAGRVTEQSPETQIVYMSIKPSPGRTNHWPKIKSANEKIKQFSDDFSNYHFVDVSKVMLDQGGQPEASIFLADGVHMNAQGYDRWTNLLEPILRKLYLTHVGLEQTATKVPAD